MIISATGWLAGNAALSWSAAKNADSQWPPSLTPRLPVSGIGREKDEASDPTLWVECLERSISTRGASAAPAATVVS